MTENERAPGERRRILETLTDLDVPTDVVYMLPFVAMMIVLVAFSRRAYLPAALCQPYRREGN